MIFPDLMSFMEIGSRLFIVGGSETSNGKPLASRKCFYIRHCGLEIDPRTIIEFRQRYRQPVYPRLETICSDRFIISGKQEIQFEMLDTSDPEGEWCALPVPKLNVSEKGLRYCVYSVAAESLGDGLEEEGGTYVFDIDNQIWNYASNEVLPFAGVSLKTEIFCAFRLRYENNGLQIDEIEIDDPCCFSTPLPPQIYSRPIEMVHGPNG